MGGLEQGLSEHSDACLALGTAQADQQIDVRQEVRVHLSARKPSACSKCQDGIVRGQRA